MNGVTVSDTWLLSLFIRKKASERDEAIILDLQQEEKINKKIKKNSFIILDNKNSKFK